MLLAFTLWPWVYMAGFFAMVLVLFVSGAASAAAGDARDMGGAAGDGEHPGDAGVLVSVCVAG